MFSWSLKIVFKNYSEIQGNYTHVYTPACTHTHTHAKHTLFTILVDFMKTMAFRTSWLSPISKFDWKYPVSVTFIYHTHIQHWTRNVSLDSSCRVAILLVSALSWAFKSLLQAENINKVNSFIYNGSDTGLL